MIQNPNIHNLAQQQAMNNGLAYGEGGYPMLPTNLNDVENRITDNSTMAKKTVGMTDPEVLMKAPLVFAVIYGLQILLSKRFSGSYTSSLIGKLEAFADKFANLKPVKMTLDKLYKAYDGVIDFFVRNKDKTKITQAMAMPTKTEFSFAKGMVYGADGFAVGDAIDVINHLKKKFPNAIWDKYTPEFMDNLRSNPTKANLKMLAKDLTDPAIKDEPFWFGVIPRKTSTSEIANKLKALSGDGSPDGTRFGKTISDFFMKFGEAITGGFFGGAMSIFMQSAFTAYAYERSKQAPKGEKLATGMEEFVQQVAFFAAMPLAMKSMHMFGGLKYTGLDEAGKATYQKALKEINDKIDSGVIKDKTALKAAKQELSKLLNSGAKWYHKPFKWIGNTVAFGLERLRPFKDSKWARVKHFTKGFTGGMGRVGLYMFVFGAMFSNPFIRLSHLIFGKPKDSILDPEPSEEELNKKPKDMQIKLDDVIAPQGIQAQQQNPFVQQQAQQQQLAQQQPQNQIPASNLNEPQRTYVPSPVAVNYPTKAPQQQEQMDIKTQQALLQADMLEQEALALLGKQGMA